MMEQFQPDIFHMGGDEINFKCWSSTKNIENWMIKRKWNFDDDGFIKLWNHFQNNAVQRLYKKAGYEIPVIMWSSQLIQEDYLTKSLPKDKYIIQIWASAGDSQIELLLKEGYRVIVSNHDALYLDCGFASWVSDGNNWCSPYIGWQKIYENTPFKIAGKFLDP